MEGPSTNKCNRWWLLGFVALGAFFLRGHLADIQTNERARVDATFEGRTAAQWLASTGWTLSGENDEARRAIKQLGTNSIPGLIKVLQTSGSMWELRFLWHVPFARKLHGSSLTKAELKTRAIDAIALLGEEGRAAVPVMLKLANSRSEWIDARNKAIGYLALYGYTDEAVRASLNALRNDPEVGGAASSAFHVAEQRLAEQQLRASLSAIQEIVRQNAPLPTNLPPLDTSIEIQPLWKAR